MTTKMDSDDLINSLSAFYRQVHIAPDFSVARLRRAASRLDEPVVSARGFKLDAELAWVAWLEAQAADSEEDADRIDDILRELIPDLGEWRRYVESFPPGPENQQFRARRVLVADAMVWRRQEWDESASLYRYAAASEADDVTAAVPGEDYKTSIRTIVDDGYLRCFVDIESQRDIVSAKFQFDIQFRGGRRMSGIFKFPDHSHFGVNVGPLHGLRLEDIESYRLARLEED